MDSLETLVVDTNTLTIPFEYLLLFYVYECCASVLSMYTAVPVEAREGHCPHPY